MQDLLYATQWVRAGAGDANIVRYWLSKGVLYSSVTMFHSITPLTTSLVFCILGYVGSKCEALSYRSNHAVHTITNFPNKNILYQQFGGNGKPHLDATTQTHACAACFMNRVKRWLSQCGSLFNHFITVAKCICQYKYTLLLYISR